MEVKKRDGKIVDFEREKINRAIFKSFRSVDSLISDENLDKISLNIENTIKERYPKDHVVTVEEIQDLVELELIENNYYKEVKSYILYRAKHNMDRKVLTDFESFIDDEYTLSIIKDINDEYDNQRYPIESLYLKFESFTKKNMTKEALLNALIKAASELTSKEAPDWEFIAARFMIHLINLKISLSEEKYGIVDFRSKVQYLSSAGLYGKYILESYSNKDLEELGAYLKEERNKLFTYSGLDLVAKRYLIKTFEGEYIESVQEIIYNKIKDKNKGDNMLKILLLEDDNTISFAIKKYLEKFKYSVKIFKTISATEDLSLNEFDLIVLDVNLPDGNGFDYLNYVRSFSKIPIIMLTVKNDEKYIKNLTKQLDQQNSNVNTLNKLLENQQILALESNKKIQKLENQLEEERQLNYSFDKSTNDRKNFDVQEASYTSDSVNTNQYQKEEINPVVQSKGISENQQDGEKQKENDKGIAIEETQTKKGFWSRLFGG